MANHIVAVLNHWFMQKDELDWVLATVIDTQGSSYRKPGAMMVINSLGLYFGLVSGGCLESDIMRQARKCWMDGKQRTIVYDMLDEDDFAWKLGIGCGGRVDILLQPISHQNNYLQLDEMLNRLRNNQSVYYRQSLQNDTAENDCRKQFPDGIKRNSLVQKGEEHYFVSAHQPVTRLAVFGGGVDAQPLVKIADAMGWYVTLFDSRLGYAKPAFFPESCEIRREDYSELTAEDLAHCYAAILMNHNVDLDAKALSACHAADLSYIGLLGPNHRTERVLMACGLTVDDFDTTVSNPVGLALGGELPESIALSIIAEIHAHLHGVTPRALSTFENLRTCLQITA